MISAYTASEYSSGNIIQFDQTKSDPEGGIHSSIAESTKYGIKYGTNK